ncbi:MAG: hypothetical protein GQ581_00175 [Methyloprofundus sp.]|nr:hypothetical protein [Methyloprofundus sp.]
MSDNHNGFIHKSYQLLFILYAPVALISILVKFLSDSNVNYIYLTALITAGFSVVIGLIMCIQFWRHREVIARDKETHIPYMIRHRFMIMYIPIVIISLLISSYYIFDKFVNKVEFYKDQHRTQIALLFPLKNELDVQFDDTEQVRLGFGAFFTNFPEYSNQYHLTVFDHKNKYNPALEKEVLAKINAGTRYFICAYSDVCSQLANNFDHLLEQSTYKERPILITTLSSSMALPLEKNKFYRFFVRNREEARILALKAYTKGIRKASFIAAKDAYGTDAAQVFIEAWQDLGGELIEGVYIDPSLSADVVANKIQQSKLTQLQDAAVFVAHYQNINKSLQQLPKGTHYLLSANYQQNAITELAKNIPHPQISFALPSYKIANPKLRNTAAAFAYMTLSKLIHADMQLQNEEGMLFHTAWHQADYPVFLEFRTEGVADFRVAMDAFNYGEDIYQEK